MTGIKNVDLSRLQTPDYKGSVQNLYYLEEDANVMVCETTSSGSVFDVGSIYTISGSDICRAAFRHALYSQLQTPEPWQAVNQMLQEEYGDKKRFLDFLSGSPNGGGLLEQFQVHGAPTHHLGMIDQTTGQVYHGTFPPQVSPFVLVEKFNVIKPTPVSYRTNHFWDYSPCREQTRNVIPLENIVRFGITSGSSIYRKFLRMEEKQRRAFLKELGVEELPLWRFFAVPLVDFTSKYEPEDRCLTYQEALHVSGCTGNQFLEIIQMSLLGSHFVKHFLKGVALTLWDMKWEIAKRDQQLVFVDTIDTDSLRMTCTVTEDEHELFVHFNKQAMRDYYKILHADWFEAVNLAKAAAAVHGVSFHEILADGQKTGQYPQTPVVQEAFLKIQERKFKVLLEQILAPPQPGDGTMVRLARADEIKAIAREEVDFYKKAGLVHSFLAINGLRR